MKTPFFLVAAFHLAIALACSAAETISVTDFGVRPNSRENAVAGVKQALESCRKAEDALLVFPQGRYDFWPQHAQERVYYESNSYDNNPKTCAILMEDFKGLTVDGSGSAFVFHGRMQPFTVERCERVTIRNLTIDWDIPLTAQGEVVDVSDATIDLKIDPCESPYVIEDEKIVFVGEGWKSRWGGTIEFERETRLIPPSGGDGCRLEGDVLGRDIHIENMAASEVTLAPGQGISGPQDEPATGNNGEERK